MKILFLFLICICAIGCNIEDAQKDCVEANVVGIKDGDSMEVLYKNKILEIRLVEIDCPEKGQDYGNAAKKFTSRLCFGKNVIIIGNEKDRYGRRLATVLVDDININAELLKNGLAWHYKKYSNNKKYAEYEKEARTNGTGLWSMPQPIPPPGNSEL